MKRIVCDIITEPIKNLATQLKCSPAFACNLVSTWKTQNQSADYPTLQQAQDFLKSEKGIVDEIFTAIPVYTDGQGNQGKAAPFDDSKPLASSNKSTIILRYLPQDNPMEYFFDYILGNLNNETSQQKKKVFENLSKEGYTLDKIKGLLSNPTEVYQFLLWHEMSHIQNADKSVYWNNGKDYMTPDKIAIETRATIEALRKAERYRKTHPATPQVGPKVQEVMSGFAGYFEGGGAIIENDYPNLSKEMIDKFKSFLWGQGQFTEDDAIRFLEESKTSNVAREFTVENANTLNVEELPTIGTPINALKVDLNNPIARLSRDFSPMERHDRVIMMARQFSTIVDGLVSETLDKIDEDINTEMSKETPDLSEVQRLNENRLAMLDPIKGRRTAIKTIGIETIFQKMKDEFSEYLSLSPEELQEEFGERADYTVNAYSRILDNFDALLDEACIYIENAENLRVVTDRHTVSDGRNTDSVIGGAVVDSSADTDTQESQFEDDEDGNRAEGNGGWSFKVRFVDPRSSLSKDVKKILANIKKEGINGEPEIDDLGYTRYINQEYAHAVLINELSSMIDANDFSRLEDGNYRLYALERTAQKYPWVNQVISELQADPKLISAFFADFRKDFISYWMQKEGKTFALNKAVALDSTLAGIVNNYEQGTALDEDSIYSTGNTISQENANKGKTLVNSVLTYLRDFTEDDIEDITTNITKGLRMLGLNVNPNIVTSMFSDNETLVNLEKVVNAMRDIFDGIERMPEDGHLIDSFSQEYNVIATYVGEVTELDNIQSFRQGDKTYYSYSAPNYVDTMFKCLKSDERRDQYLSEQFKKYDWFYRNGSWRNEWLNLLENDEDVRSSFAMKELNNIDGIEYTQWQPLDIKKAFILEYFSAGYNEGSKKQFAWYNLPIFSDSPVVKFVKFKRYTTDNEGTFKQKLIPLFNKVVMQELSRIKLVRERRNAGVSQIANFDKNGDKFHFFPELNNYEVGGVKFLAMAEDLVSKKDAKGLRELINEALETILNSNFENFLTTNFSQESSEALQYTLLDQGAINANEQFIPALEEYFWNQAFATSQIIQLTTTDLAFYKDGTDFQKRYKEVYAAGTKLNTNSTYGREIEKTIYLSDQIITSRGYSDIKTSLDRAVGLGHIKPYDREAILNKFKDINVADAQAYRSLSSMRAVLDMMGAWNDDMQASFDRFQSGEWDMKDFNTVWQTIKPFVFTQIEKPNGIGGVMKVPHQNKNSEFLLLSMYQMVSSSTGQSAKMRAINKFMENNDIDVVQFESAVKAGKQGCIDVSYSPTKLADLISNLSENNSLFKNAFKDGTFKDFKKVMDKLLSTGKIGQEEYNKYFDDIEPSEEEVLSMLEKYSKIDGQDNPSVVHSIPYSDYVIQQPTPEHLFDVEAVYGSQFRNLIISDMPNDHNFRVKINGRDYTKQEVLDLYQSNIVENLLEDYQKVSKKFANIEALQAAMMEQVKGNPKYGRDMVNALQLVEIVNPTTGKKEKVFNIPLNNPSTTLKLQELVNAMFKNGITKQHIKGGACILVSNFGLTKELNIIHNADGSINGIECYLPAYSKKFYEPFMVEKTDEQGNTYQELDIKKMPKELRKLVGYRIPTENKYSMAPLIIKGFLPQQNGSAIMLPADITQIAGSDFDVDKMFLMIPEFTVQRYDKRKAREDYARENEVFKNILSQFTNSELAEDFLNADTDDFNTWFREHENEYLLDEPIIRKVKYDTSKSPSENSRQQRNNMLIDIAYGVLTNIDTAEKIHNPGNFDKAKLGARIATIIGDADMFASYKEEKGITSDSDAADALLSANLDVLDDFVSKYKRERSPLSIDTFIYNHRQNMTGGALIGMYANNTTMQSKFQVTGLAIKDEHVFFINGKRIQSLHDIYNEDNELVSSNCAQFSAASVDNVKDPVLADLMQNTKTANIAGFMLRAGMSVKEISLLFTQPMIKRCITETGGLRKLSKYIGATMAELKKLGGGVDIEHILQKDFDSKSLIMNSINELNVGNLTPEQLQAHLASSIEAAVLMNHIATMADDLSKLTQIGRADSPNGAIATSIAAAKNQVQKVTLYERASKERSFHLTGLQDAMKNNYVSLDMTKDQMREQILKSKMPMLQAFYSLGIEFGTKTMKNFFVQTNDFSDALVEELYKNSPRGIVADDTLNKFYDELVEFGLTKTELFGNDSERTYDEKRDYYLYRFPKKFLGIIADNPDIANLNIIRKMLVQNGSIVMKRSGRLTPTMREALMRDLDTLLYMNNPNAQKLAVDLFMYSFYKDGFKFGPNSFGTFFSSTFITSFPEFINALREMQYNMKAGTFYDKFLAQFYSNHWQEGLVPEANELRVQEVSDTQFIIPTMSVSNKNDGNRPYVLLTHGDSLYSLKEAGNKMCVYVKENTITDHQGKKYNANMTAREMAAIQTDARLIEQAGQLNGSTRQTQSFEDLFNQDMSELDAFFADESFNVDLLSEVEERYTEDEGNAQLDNDLCK